MILPACEDRIHQAASLRDVASDYISFRRYGKDERGPCPIHGGTHNNFCYYAATDSGFCHQCKTYVSGAADFLMKLQGLTYPQALRRLAERYGIEIEETYQTAEAQAEADRKKSMLEVYDVACEWYEQQLWDASATTDDSAIVREYLHKRGLNDQTIRTFRLGCSPRDAHALGRHLLAQGYTQDLLTESHLLYASQDSRLFDKYHGRLVFPLCDNYGRCIGFTGRTLSQDPEDAKYINSRESLLFQKRYTLYGLHIARAAMARAGHVYLVEGLTDVMMMHQCGIYNVVASQGTAICAEQIAMIKKICPKVTVVLDGDQAGITATKRALALLLEAGLVCEVVTLPDGEDPASYGVTCGADALRKTVAQGIDFVQWLWDGVQDKASVEARVQCVKQVAAWISKVKDVVYREEYVRHACAVLEVDQSVLKDAISSSADATGSSRAPRGRPGASKQSARKASRRQWRDDETENRPIKPLQLDLGKILTGSTYD